MASITNMLQTIQNFFTLKDTYGTSNGATSAALSGSELQQACDAYRSNPSTETARDVLRADKAFFETLIDFFGSLPVPGILPTDLATEAAKAEASNMKKNNRGQTTVYAGHGLIYQSRSALCHADHA